MSYVYSDRPAVVWAHMPFGSIIYPNLALGQFKAQLTEAGLSSVTLNLNVRFARMVGFASYETVARFKGVETQVSEWLFSADCWGEECGPSVDEFLRLCGEELTTIPRVTDQAAWLRKVRSEVVPQFLDRCVQAVGALGPPPIVGFSCTFFQTIAALALGRRLKEAFPWIKLIYGGACFHGEMGDELIRKTPWIDAVSTGEADAELVPLVSTLLEGGVPRGLPGIIARDANGELASGPRPQPATAAQLEVIPDPDFDEYFTEIRAHGLHRDASFRERVFLPFEASRGCWWGQKNHCTFCGLNAEGMGYRAKTSTRVEDSLRALAARYPISRIHATDNILAIEHIRELLPRLAARPVVTHDAVEEGLRLFFEVKANVTRAQIKAMADAGIMTVQPGLESLSSHQLKLMGKGVTALQNVYFLKLCREYGVSALWNILIRIPGEAAEDYAEMCAWIPKLVHLQPPSGGAPLVEVHRFSPYFAQGDRWLEDVRPMPWYRGLFPADRYDLARVAYYFDATWKDTLGGDTYDELRAQTLAWIERYRLAERMPALVAHEAEDGGIVIDDTRGDEPVRWTLDAAQARVLRAIDDPARTSKVARALADAGAPVSDEATLRGILRGFCDAGIALEERDTFLGLALPPRVDALAQDYRRKQIRRIVNQGPAPAQAESRRLAVLAG
ncbi:MAG: RiPP maturation radical SAM C-methyltransferase [Myxococcales bacterium]|nr:RiPP maturation radical SAM C-methyltransferase [Myxococcales bacterium]